MWNLVFAVAKRYAPVITFPIAIVVGFIGYNAESVLTDKSTPARTMTVAEERDERILRELEGEKNNDDSSRYSKTLPKTVLDRNDFRKGARDSKVKVDD